MAHRCGITPANERDLRCNFHDLSLTCITMVAESHGSDMTIMAIADM